jgi:hypothetical protein
MWNKLKKALGIKSKETEWKKITASPFIQMHR